MHVLRYLRTLCLTPDFFLFTLKSHVQQCLSHVSCSIIVYAPTREQVKALGRGAINVASITDSLQDHSLTFAPRLTRQHALCLHGSAVRLRADEIGLLPTQGLRKPGLRKNGRFPTQVDTHTAPASRLVVQGWYGGAPTATPR